jgi:tRNA1Val (adenine37-N6)-methyltransferase
MKSTFEFKHFAIQQYNSSMKVTSDAVLLGAFAAYHHPFGQSNPSSSSILDIGCGTGLLSIMLAQQMASLAIKNDLSIDAIDIDPQAILDAKQNCENSPWQHMIHLHKHSILNMPLQVENQDRTQSYRLIICNPPFYNNNKLSDDLKRNRAWHLDNGLSPSVLANKTLELLCDQGEAYFLWPTIEAKQFVDALCQSSHPHRTDMKNTGILIEVIELLHKPDAPSKRSMVKLQLLHNSESRVIHTTLRVFDDNQNYQANIAHILQPYYRFID